MIRLARVISHRLLPAPVRRAGRGVFDQIGIYWDRAVGRKGIRTPPIDLVDGIGGSWWVGENYLRHFRELAGLKPDEAVLDVGCGVGRMAAPLTGFLNPAGRYEGFDIVPANVRWCRREIAPRWPNFRFRHADIYNREYNPGGKVLGHEFRFPYPDSTFDFAFLTSVFTHLMPPDAAHYLGELGRVLKPGGRCLATFFLLNPESRRLVDENRGRITLLPGDGQYRVHRADIPETCIALDERFIQGEAETAGLSLDPVRYGSWCGRESGFEFQDLAILRKASA